eukprot:20945-Pelagococcus_subviridis.AAC.6
MRSRVSVVGGKTVGAPAGTIASPPKSREGLEPPPPPPPPPAAAAASSRTPRATSSAFESLAPTRAHRAATAGRNSPFSSSNGDAIPGAVDDDDDNDAAAASVAARHARTFASAAGCRDNAAPTYFLSDAAHAPVRSTSGSSSRSPSPPPRASSSTSASANPSLSAAAAASRTTPAASSGVSSAADVSAASVAAVSASAWRGDSCASAFSPPPPPPPPRAVARESVSAAAFNALECARRDSTAYDATSFASLSVRVTCGGARSGRPMNGFV